MSRMSSKLKPGSQNQKEVGFDIDSKSEETFDEEELK